MRLATLAVNAGTTIAAAPARHRFERAARAPRDAQRRILARILRDTASSAYGRLHGVGSIRTPEEYAARVPLVTHDAMAPWIDRVAAGELAVMTGEPVRFLEPTGGSTGYIKLIPYTTALRAEFAAATLPWVYDLLVRRPAIATGRAYWAITPPGERAARTTGGLPVGMQDDAEYFPGPVRALLRHALAVPSAVGRAADVDRCRYLTLLALLAADDLTLVSVWSPTFLTLLADALTAQWSELLSDLERVRSRRARALRARFGGTAPEDLSLVWPSLCLISCWTEGHAAHALAGVRRRFPRVEIQGKGLMATEGVVSIPLRDAVAPVAAVTSHYVELIEPDSGRARGLHEAEAGATYEVALTTGGGLLRYRLRDLVRVEGFWHRTPMLSFRGRTDGASDMAGEKLTPALAAHAIADAMRATGAAPAFAMLAPCRSPVLHYRLYAEVDPADAGTLADAVDAALRNAHHYALCRSLRQLAPVRGVAVADGFRRYERACAARGQRTGALKPPALDATQDWSAVFERDRVTA